MYDRDNRSTIEGHHTRSGCARKWTVWIGVTQEKKVSGQEETVGGKQGTEVGDVCPVSGRRREKQGPRLEDHRFYVREVGVQAKSGGKTVRIFKWGSEGF